MPQPRARIIDVPEVVHVVRHIQVAKHVRNLRRRLEFSTRLSKRAKTATVARAPLAANQSEPAERIVEHEVVQRVGGKVTHNDAFSLQVLVRQNESARERVQEHNG